VTTRPVSCALLTQGEHVPSTRYRIAQYVRYLPEHGVTPLWLDARFGAYPPAMRSARILWGPATLANGLQRIIKSRRSEVMLVQRSLVSSFRTFENFSGRPLIIDVDDAVFLHGRRGWHERLARHAAHIVCGNDYLADHYQRFAPVTVIPTTVDTQRFTPHPVQHWSPIIGWSGTSSGFPFLYSIESALSTVLQRFPLLKLKIVSDQRPSFKTIPESRLILERWAPAAEVESLRSFTVGLMPLEDSAWARGKCAFKMLTYMAVGIPVVVSPIGANSQVLAMGEVGLAARSNTEWVDALTQLLESPQECARMGGEGRLVVERHFDTRSHAQNLAAVIRHVAGLN
jgi:glycosyltransferase involved in cell wall biosynthesis